MKPITTSITLALFTLFLAAAPAMGQVGPSHAYIQVEGLACPFCVQGLEKHLKRLDGVDGVTVSLKDGEVVLHIQPGETVDEKEVREAVRRAGFTAGRVKIEKGTVGGGTEDSSEPSK